MLPNEFLESCIFVTLVLLHFGFADNLHSRINISVQVQFSVNKTVDWRFFQEFYFLFSSKCNVWGIIRFLSASYGLEVWKLLNFLNLLINSLKNWAWNIRALADVKKQNIFGLKVFNLLKNHFTFSKKAYLLGAPWILSGKVIEQTFCSFGQLDFQVVRIFWNFFIFWWNVSLSLVQAFFIN